jgi:methylmalonyl-CoA mutase C-terminal domain/subunit
MSAGSDASSPHNPPIRVVLGNPGLDGHDRGLKVVARALCDGGMEVVYLPLRQTVEQLAAAAVQEDADVVGISNLSATLVTACSRTQQLLRDAGADDVLIICGGIVTAADRAALNDLGIEGIFGPGTDTREIVAFIRSHVR